MRKMFTLFTLLIVGHSYSQCVIQKENSNSPFCQLTVKAPLINGLTGKVVGLNVHTESNDTLKRATIYACRCIRTFSGNNNPLLVLDGVPTELPVLTKLNPNDIESVTVLKNAAATAIYGCEGRNGVIIITTKGLIIRKFIIKDSLDGSRIAGATLLITSVKDRNEKFQFVANDSGMVVTDKLNRFGKYQMIVSSVGHKTFQQVFENRVDLKKEEIFLVREIKICDEVIVSAGHGFGCCLACGFTIYRQKRSGTTTIIAGADKKEQAPVVPFEFKAYPNPVQRSGSLNLQFDNADGKQKIIRVISLDGRTLLRQSFNTSKGKNVFQLPTDARWAAGIYFVQLLYENGRVAASEKVIIQ